MKRQELADPSQWFCVHTHPGKELLAASRLQAQGYNAYCPMFEVQTKSHGKIKKPLLPRYLFVNFNPRRRAWQPIQSTPGVAYILTYTYFEDEHTLAEVKYSVPCPVRPAEIEKIRRESKEEGIVWLIKPDMRVRVVNGPWQNHEALVTWTQDDRAKLLLTLFNVAHELEFYTHQLEVISG